MSIKVNNVTKIYGQQKALDHVSFTINSGEIVGFLGPNGAGKSTMMKIITGFIPCNSGQVLVNDLDIKKNPIKVKKLIGYLPENNPLYPDMYIKEYLDFIAGIYKVKNIPQKIEQVIELTGIEREQHKKIGALSKGYRQRVGLAASLIHDPQVLILDEPTTGLDPNQIIEIRNLISQIGQSKTVMLSTHIMQEVEAICDRVIIISKGKIVADDSAENLQSRKSEQTVIIEFDKPVDEKSFSEVKNIRKLKKIHENKWIVQANGKSDIRFELSDFARNNNLIILSLIQKEKSLEEVFRELTN